MMTLPPYSPARGGFHKPALIGPWILGKLSGGRETWSQELYGEWKDEMLAIPLAVYQRAKQRKPRVGGKRKVMSFHSFRVYIYMLFRLNLIEYVRNPNGSIKEDDAHFKDGSVNPKLPKTQFFHAVPGNLGSGDWDNVWSSYRGII